MALLQVSGAVSTLQEPFLDGGDGRRASVSPGRRGLVQRVVGGLQWPDPTATLVVLLCVAGCACLADSQQGGAAAQQEKLDISPLDPGIVAVVGEPPPGLEAGFGTLSGVAVLASAAMLMVVFLISQWGTRAVRKLSTTSLPLKVDSGPVRTWFLLGHMEMRNVFLRNPVGYRSGHLLHVRRMTLDISLLRCIWLLGRQLEVRSLRLDGVSVVLEKGPLEADHSSNLQSAVVRLEEHAAAAASGGAGALFVREVVVADAAVFEVGRSSHPSAIPDMTFLNLSKEEGASGMGLCMAALLKHIGDSAVTSLHKLQP